ncbi:hypothetical protein [Methanobrevibacter sp.]|uniref:hypothetical protein n=1 Tax=Methanobrevibacter sp. TaxID=66852 RepID=UPI00388F9922
MLFKELLNHFSIDEEFPDYLLDESFNKIFLDGDFSKIDNSYKIEITTRQDVTHTMIINPQDEFPVIVISKLPNGRLNGIKFGRSKGQLAYINEI